jgi:hypothetical protein
MISARPPAETAPPVTRRPTVSAAKSKARAARPDTGPRGEVDGRDDDPADAGRPVSERVGGTGRHRQEGHGGQDRIGRGQAHRGRTRPSHLAQVPRGPDGQARESAEHRHGGRLPPHVWPAQAHRDQVEEQGPAA